MPSMKKYIALTLGLLLLAAVSVEAAPISPDISITGDISYDTGFSFVDNASHSGTMTATVGGATTTTTYDSGTPSAPTRCWAP